MSAVGGREVLRSLGRENNETIANVDDSDAGSSNVDLHYFRVANGCIVLSEKIWARHEIPLDANGRSVQNGFKLTTTSPDLVGRS